MFATTQSEEINQRNEGNVGELKHTRSPILAPRGDLSPHSQANPDSPLFTELCGIARKTIGLAEPLREALAPLASGIVMAFVYGSVAKRQDTASSDIDLMVVSDGLSYADVFEALEAIGARLGRAVNPTVYTRRELAKRLKDGNAFVKRVLAQPKVWVIGTEDDLAA